MAITPETVAHRLRYAGLGSLRPTAVEFLLKPPGISLLLCGTPDEAVDQMRQIFPTSRKWRMAQTVATANVAAIRGAGFEVIPSPSRGLANHARLIHALGAAGFTDANLAVLAAVFRVTTGV